MDLPEFRDPEFAGLRAQLARAYLAHKAELGVPHASDQDILDQADDITALMLGRAHRAFATGNSVWLVRYCWFTELIEALADERSGRLLDG